MQIVNFWGPPGSGKSTSAAYCFSHLKNKGVNCELVTEYAKEMVYAKRQAEMSNQIYLLAKQYKRLKDIERYEKVPIVLTDSPLIQNLIYSPGLSYYTHFEKVCRALADEFQNINVFVRRVKAYNPSGRNQTEAESDALLDTLAKLKISYDYTIDGDVAGQRKFAQELENLIVPF